MAIFCEKFWNPKGEAEIRVLEYRSLDSLAVIPGEIQGLPVTELAPYVFSEHVDHNAAQPGETFWWKEEEASPGPDLPPLTGHRLAELRLPSSLRKIGAYAFYNCEKLKKLELYSQTLDWGHGVFTGCSGLSCVKIHVDETQKSCMKEVLSELRQTLRVEYLSRERASLIFPEFFEDMVENTPARIVVTETHGCGKQYRNAFVNTQFQFREYDRLFPHVQVQEPEALVIELALGRVMHPCQLSQEARTSYLEYLTDHREQAACCAVRQADLTMLSWLTGNLTYGPGELKAAIQEAGTCGNMEAVSFLMEQSRGQESGRRRRFSL